MPRKLPRPHEQLQISGPCDAEWDSMAGNERVRFCAHCSLSVHNLSEVTPRQAMELVLRSGGRLCLRIERDRAGVPRTRALAPLHQIRRRASGLATSAFGAVLTLCSTASAQSPAQEPARQQQEAQGARPSDPAPAAADAGAAVADDADTESVTVGAVAVVVEPREPLVKAVMENDLEAVRKLLLIEGADVNVLDENLGVSALAEAYRKGNREMLRELLWRGARVNDRLSYRQTALMRLSPETTAEAVRDLLDAGAKVNLRDEDGNTALIFASAQGRPEVVELLLRAGAKVNARNREGRTALMSAAIVGSAEAVRSLILAGADVSLRDEEGRSALWHARQNGEGEAAALLLAFGAYEEPEQKR